MNSPKNKCIKSKFFDENEKNNPRKKSNKKLKSIFLSIFLQ